MKKASNYANPLSPLCRFSHISFLELLAQRLVSFSARKLHNKQMTCEAKEINDAKIGTKKLLKADRMHK